MTKQARFLAHGALIAALYAVLCYLQNFLLPGSATWAIQMRVAEVLCVLAFFTPAAIPGLGIGCLLFTLSYAGALPLDFLVGWELTVYIGGGFWLNALYVALGEWIVLLTLGSALYLVIQSRGLDTRLFARK